MAAAEMGDYLLTLAADYTATELTLLPQDVLVEEGQLNQTVLIGDDGSEQVVRHSDVRYFFVTLRFLDLDEADAGTLFDLYFHLSKALGAARTFYWQAPDNYTYTVRFAGPLQRSRRPAARHAVDAVRLKVLGRKP